MAAPCFHWSVPTAKAAGIINIGTIGQALLMGTMGYGYVSTYCYCEVVSNTLQCNDLILYSAEFVQQLEIYYHWGNISYDSTLQG